MSNAELDRYLRKCQARGLAPKTLSNYKLSLSTFYAWWEDRDLLTITNDDIDDYIFHLQDDCDINPTTINNRLRDLRAYLIYCQGRKVCGEVKISLISLQEIDIVPFTEHQLRELYDACKGSSKTFERVRDYTIMRMMEETGLRISEVLRLQIGDISLTENQIDIRQTKNKRNRQAYLTPDFKRELIMYMETRKLFLEKKGKESNAVWLTNRAGSVGNALSVRGFQQNLTKYGDYAGIKDVRVSPHTFRHTFARNFIVAGGDIYTLKELLGHSTLEMSMRYINLFGKDKQRAYLKVMANVAKERKRQEIAEW